MKTLLLTLSLFLGMTLGITAATPKPVEYNVGLCSPDQFIALHFSVEEKSFSITDVARGPAFSHKLPEPFVYKLDSTDKDGVEHFVMETGEFDIKIDKDGISGVFLSDGKKVALVDGVRGEAATLAADGQALYDSCESKRNTDPAKASN